jgi:hypothetical protein
MSHPSGRVAESGERERREEDQGNKGALKIRLLESVDFD